MEKKDKLIIEFKMDDLAQGDCVISYPERWIKTYGVPESCGITVPVDSRFDEDDIEIDTIERFKEEMYDMVEASKSGWKKCEELIESLITSLQNGRDPEEILKEVFCKLVALDPEIKSVNSQAKDGHILLEMLEERKQFYREEVEKLKEFQDMIEDEEFEYDFNIMQCGEWFEECTYNKNAELGLIAHVYSDGRVYIEFEDKNVSSYVDDTELDMVDADNDGKIDDGDLYNYICTEFKDKFMDDSNEQDEQVQLIYRMLDEEKFNCDIQYQD